MQNIRKCQVENLVASYQGHFNAALQYSGVMPGKSQNAVLQLYSIIFFFAVSKSKPKILENLSKLTKSIGKSLGLRPQKQYIMTYCCRNSTEGALLQYTGQKRVLRITPEY